MILVCALVLCASLSHAQTLVSGKAVYYPNNTRVDSVLDRVKKETTEITYDSREVMISKKVYLLNDQGMPTQGVIYDGVGTFTARAQYYYDDLGRMIEQRMFNTRGEIFQRTIFQYGSDGKALPPAVYKMNNVAAPSMKQATIDFTGTKAAGKNANPSAAAQAPPRAQIVQPGQTPLIMTLSPRTGVTTPQPQLRQPDKKTTPSPGAGKK